MYPRRPRRKPKYLGAVVEDDEPAIEDSPYTSKTLRLGIVQPGTYVRWGSLTNIRGQEPTWVVVPSQSRVVSSETKHEEEEEEDIWEEVEDEEEEEDEGGYDGRADNKVSGISHTHRSQDAMSEDDDPNNFVMKIRKDLDVQKQMLRILMRAHKKAREEWANTPFKMTGLEGRAEAEVLKLLFLVADQPLEDERITPEQVEELKSQTPYGQFPILHKCGQTFGDASALTLACATKFQLFGETVQEQMVVGATYSRLRRLQEKHKRTLAWIFCGQVKDKAKIEWAQSQLLHVILPPVIREWDQQIRSTKGPFLVESGMTLADLAIMDFLDQCASHVMIDSVLADHLAVSDLIEAVRSCPKLLAHLQEREEE